MKDLKCKLLPSVIYKVDRDRVTVISLDNEQSYFEIHGAAALVWQQMAKGITITKIIDKLAKKHSIAKSRAQKDVTLFLKQLAKKGLIENERRAK